MSMHEIEDLVHASVLVLDRHHPDGDERLRDWFVALYDFQRGFDCSHTQGRVLDILLRRGHTYRFGLAEHPDLDLSAVREFTFVSELTGDDEGSGYVDPPYFCCEVGGSGWRRMVDAGKLTGADAVAPRPVRLLEAVLPVCVAAERDGDVELIASWYQLGHQMLVGGAPFDVEDLLATPGVAELRAVVDRTGALAVELPDGYRPTEADLEAMDDELESWWYRPA